MMWRGWTCVVGGLEVIAVTLKCAVHVHQDLCVCVLQVLQVGVASGIRHHHNRAGRGLGVGLSTSDGPSDGFVTLFNVLSRESLGGAGPWRGVRIMVGSEELVLFEGRPVRRQVRAPVHGGSEALRGG